MSVAPTQGKIFALTQIRGWAQASDLLKGECCQSVNLYCLGFQNRLRLRHRFIAGCLDQPLFE
jgi:hypothetical protein